MQVLEAFLKLRIKYTIVLMNDWLDIFPHVMNVLKKQIRVYDNLLIMEEKKYEKNNLLDNYFLVEEYNISDDVKLG